MPNCTDMATEDPYFCIRAVLRKKGITGSCLATQGISITSMKLYQGPGTYSKVSNWRALNKGIKWEEFRERNKVCYNVLVLMTMGSCCHLRPEEERSSGFWNLWRKPYGEGSLKSSCGLWERVTNHPKQPSSVGLREINTKILLSSYLPISWIQLEAREQQVCREG